MNFISGDNAHFGLSGRMKLTPFEGKSFILSSNANTLWIYKNDKAIGKIVVSTLDGNCGVCHLHDWAIYALTTEEQLELLNYIEHIAQVSSYGYIQTGLSSQQPIKDLLLKNGWECYNSFVSPRTRNLCEFFHKKLIKEGE